MIIKIWSFPYLLISVKAKGFPMAYKALHNPLWCHHFMLLTATTLASLGPSSLLCSTLPPQAFCTGCSLCPECSSLDICMAHSLNSFKSLLSGFLLLRSLLTTLCKMATHSPLCCHPPSLKSVLCFPIALIAFQHSRSLNCLLCSLFTVCFLQVDYKLQKVHACIYSHYNILSI